MDVYSKKYHEGRPKRDLRTSSRESHKRFLKENPDIKLTYPQYDAIIRDINHEYSKHLIKTGEAIELPERLGTLVILKHTRHTKYGHGPINWKATDEANKEIKEGEEKIRIYHLNYNTNGYVCNWIFFRGYLKFKDIWKFKPSKKNQSLLTEYINKRSDQYQFYKEISKYE